MFRKEKPTPKRELAILKIFQASNTIEFEATEDAKQEIIKCNFGEIQPLPATSRSYLIVSRLLVFEEVLAYLQSFKDESGEKSPGD